jgi:5-methylcytosine-specific restriction protein A
VSTKIWSKYEYEIAVKTYLKMLGMENDGQEYSKSEIRKCVLANLLIDRTVGSYEYRMQNISSVLNKMGLTYIKGYLPAENVGANGKQIIREIIEKELFQSEDCFEAVSDENILNIRANALKNKLDLSSIPDANSIPRIVERTTTSFERSPLIRAWVLKNAEGRCEACNAISSFKTSDEEFYLEIHHMKPLSVKGTDSVTNAVALCPNCHRRLHYSSDKTPYMEMIYSKVNRLKRE